MTTPIDKVLIRSMSADLQAGDVLALATDTVVGLAVDATLGSASERLDRIKKRPAHKAYVWMTSSLERLPKRLRDDLIIPEVAVDLMQRYWPGPLTLIFPTKGGKTIGVRIPSEPKLLALLRYYPHPIFMTSANVSSEKECRSYEEVARVFGRQVKNYVPSHGVFGQIPSTVVRVFPSSAEKAFLVVRQGALWI